ncbi:hypothetical protein LTR94_020966 [Friedmanniomyces endolithicus]|nr:hypothetical protein LTR94_020966 [Friedmanniomyces endolithicus]
MDTFINEGITSKVALVMAVSKHVVEAGGKRMRPIMCLLAAKACGAEDLERQRKLAAIIEMLHTATLVHDDVVDESGLRRGRPTANATWNNQTAVLGLVKLPKVKCYNFKHSTNLKPQNKLI